MRPLSALVEQASERDPAQGWQLDEDVSDPLVTGLCLDSRLVRPGDLFLCVPGSVTDGHRFAAGAVERGAVALLVERAVGTPAREIRVRDVRRAMAWVAAVFHDDPSASLSLVGVTGTNGKTSTAHLVKAVLDHDGRHCGLVGTLTGALTTPEAPVLQARLRAMVDEGIVAVAMEVSSHALVQERVTGLHFDVGVFTNLSPEHLDYHGSLEAYFEAKARLFVPGMVDAAVVNVDDPWGARLAERCQVPVTGYSADSATDVEVGLRGSAFTWRGQQVRLALPGRFNIENAVAAAEATRCLGLSDDAIAAGLGAAGQVAGRFEVVLDGAGEGATVPTVVVDYSHTPAGIEGVLRAVREIEPGATVCIVFGAGGDRDREKRPLMGAAAVANADHVVVTSDNPRSEDPQAIIAEILVGIDDPGRVDVEPDRRRAIALALGSHGPGDVVVVAGKGHETTQTTGDTVVAFDDRQVVRELAGSAS